MKRFTKKLPGHDCIRNPCGKRGCGTIPGANHGVASEEWIYAVGDGEVALSLRVMSNIYPDSVPIEDLSTLTRPFGTVLHEHHTFAVCDEHVLSDPEPCEYLDDGKCYSTDGSSIDADRFFCEYGEPRFEQPESFWQQLEKELGDRSKKLQAQRVDRTMTRCPSCRGKGVVEILHQEHKESFTTRMEKSRKMTLWNWPPSRGPQPEWMTRKPTYSFPEPVLLGDKPLVDKEIDEPHERNLRWLRTWANVVDLLQAGPELSHKLVVGAELVTAKESKRHYEKMIDKQVAAGHPPPIDDHSSTGTRCRHPVMYLDGPHPHLCQDGKHVSLTATLNYPLGKAVLVRVEPCTSTIVHPDSKPERTITWMTTGWLLWSLARAYELIYAEHEKYGVWGHAIDDLCFEQLAIDDTNVHVGVGS